MARVILQASMPDGELEQFLQLIRGWDAGRAEVTARLTIEALGMRAREVDEIIRRLGPPLPVVVKFTDPPVTES